MINQDISTFMLIMYYKHEFGSSLMKRSKVFLCNAIILCITSISLRLIGIVFNAYLIRKVGASGMGLYQLVISTYMLFVMICYAGFNMATMRLVAEELSKENNAGIRSVVKKTLRYSIISGCFAFLLLYICADSIGNIWLGDARAAVPLRMLAVVLPFIAMSSTLKGYFTAVRRVYKVSAVEMAEQLFRMALAVYLINRMEPLGVEQAFMAIALSDIIAEILSFTLLYVLFLFDRKRYNTDKNKSDTKSSRILNISLPVTFNSCLRSGINSLNKIMVPSSLERYGFSREESLGKYGIINSMILPILQLPETFLMSFASLLVPEFADFYQKKDEYSIKKVMDIIFRVVFMFSIGIIGVFSLFSKEICTMVYADGSLGIYLAVLAPLSLFLYLDLVVDSILTGLHQQVNSMFYNLVESILTTILTILLVPRYGIAGYLIVMFAGKIVNVWLSVVRLSRITGFSVRLPDWLYPAAAMLLGISVIIFLRKIVFAQAVPWGVFALLLLGLYLTQLFINGCLKRRAK